MHWYHLFSVIVPFDLNMSILGSVNYFNLRLSIWARLRARAHMYMRIRMQNIGSLVWERVAHNGRLKNDDPDYISLGSM
jgi:hypothetical protein